ncbi:ribonuclease R [Urbifossiella limnaea]|uniref:Ribonuclease R n=1 Tax=Urbifossiella limnaea TaxID=2528023 RepID=A0A517Y059_9BACT|nr:ribonuclease R [Urbifossiella limnaea]QDU23133.1 Ribonuclease R [Urbifossiella limnaea]
MSELVTRIIHAVTRPSYSPVKAKVLAKRMNVSDDEYPEFRQTLKALVREGRLAVGANQTLRPADPHGTAVGVYRRGKSGVGYVRPNAVDGTQAPDIFIREDKAADAANGDEVVVRITRVAGKLRDAAGEVVRVLTRATRTFVGTYFERDGEGFVRVDGTLFAHSVSVGDPGAKGVKPQDKVVIDLLRFPTVNDRGEGVITEVLGAHGAPGVDTLSIIKALGLPEEFPPEALAEARQAAAAFSESDLHGRTDFTDELVVTIDPADARDFDDAVSVTIDPKTKHWVLTVHIADVAHFAKPGGPLDTEARRRATSIYLPQKVIPMFPEVISNGLASLQEGKVRFVKTVRMEFTPGVQKGHVSFFNGAIRARRRFTYEQVQAEFDAMASGPRERAVPDRIEHAQEQPAHAGRSPGDDILAMLKRMRDLALLLRKKRFKRGALELSMPEAVLEYDADGRMTGAHFAEHNLSHQVIEEFMLAANEAVAEHLTHHDIPFLRRVHPAPKDEKLEAFAQFAGILGYPIKRHKDRGELQRVLNETADKPERAAVHFALLRSFKQAAYSPVQDEHYALASTHYCHFTSPIRRYPDLVVHRLLDRWIKTGRASADMNELTALGDHCSKLERRAETAERELVKVRILTFLSRRLGEKFDAVITGVAEYGFFAQVEKFPAEGLVHISSLVDDYYHFDGAGHALEGGRSRRRFRLGDRVRVEVARVDLPKRMLDFRLVPPEGKGRPEPPRPRRR